MACWCPFPWLGCRWARELFRCYPWLVWALFCTTALGGELDFANGLYRQEKYLLAAEEYEQYLSRQPDGPESVQARFFLGESYLQLRRPADAEKQFQAVFERSQAKDSPVPPDLAGQALFRLGLVAQIQEQHAEGVARFRRFRALFAAHSRRPQAEQMLADSALSAGDLPAAEEALGLLGSLGPDEPTRDKADLTRARLWEAQGKLLEARQAYDEAIARWSSQPAKRSTLLSAYLGRGLLARREDQLPTAVDMFREGRQQAKGLAIESTFALEEASTLAKLGQFDQARPLVQEVIQTTREVRVGTRAQLLMAQWAGQLGEIESAEGAWSALRSSGTPADLAEALGYLIDAWMNNKSLNLSAKAQGLESLIPRSPTPASRESLLLSTAATYLLAQEYADTARLAEPALTTASTERRPTLGYLAGMARYHLEEYEAAVPLLLTAVPNLRADLAGAALLAACQSMVKLSPERRSEETWQKAIQQIVAREDGGKLLRSVADTAYRQKDYPRAEEVFRLAVQHPQPDEPFASLGLGWSRYDQSKLEAAREAFRLALEKVPTGEGAAERSAEQAEAHYMLGVIAESMGDRAAAHEAFARVFHDFPAASWSLPAGQRWARSLAQQDKEAGDKAWAELVERSATGPARASAMVERAQLAVERGDLPTAKSLFEAVIGDPAHPAGTIVRAAIQRADLAQREGDLEGAQRFLDQADRAGVPEALAPAWAYRRGLVLRARGETEPAREVFRSVVDRFASSEFARACLLNLAEIAFETEPAQAIPLYEQLLARGDAGSYAPLASLRLAQTRLKLGEWEEAARLASELQSGSVDAGTKNEAVYVLARVHQQKAEFDQARELYRSIIGPERTETAAKAQFMLAETLFLQERWNEAVKEFLKVAILYPIPEWQSLAMVEVGKCYSRQSQITEAKKTFEEVIERYSQLPAAEEARKQLQLLETSPSKG